MSKYKAKNFFESLKFAKRGIFLILKSQRNFFIEMFFAIFAILAGIFLKFSNIEFALLFVIISLVFFAEFFNTVIEFVVDAYFGNKYSSLAKMAKDISAGGVLVLVLFSIVIGILLFFPHVLNLLS